MCVMYQIVNMLVYFEPAAMCDAQANLILEKLPARKQLWEACDELAWQAEVEREPELQSVFCVAADGDLIKIDDGSQHGDVALRSTALDSAVPSRRVANWEEWCSGMDGFGGLVMLAASLIVQ